MASETPGSSDPPSASRDGQGPHPERAVGKGERKPSRALLDFFEDSTYVRERFGLPFRFVAFDPVLGVYVFLLLLVLALGGGCGGPAFTLDDPPAPATTMQSASEVSPATTDPPAVDGGADVLEHDAQLYVGPTLDASEASDANETGTKIDASPDVLEHDGEGPSDGAAPECPAVGCICESASGSCSDALPYSCMQGAECCNWRAPGC